MELQNQMEMALTEDMPIKTEDIQKAAELLQKYKEGKTFVDQKATSNQEWWRLRHWAQMQRENQVAVNDDKPTSAWLFNSIINKHADIMDNFPKLNVLPREKDDIQEAEMLAKIIPVIHERNNEEDVYSQAGYDLIIDGGAITGVFWDSSANNGMGDIVKRNVDVHNLFWEPGISDIQESANLFNVALEDVDALKEMYPQHAAEIGPGDSGTIAKYLHDDNIDTSNKCEVVDWYYKKMVMVPTVVDPESGQVMMAAPREVLHYVKFVNQTILYASENVPEYRNVGYYDHGKYPFVIRRLFPVKDTPWGFGYVDIMKSPQKYIDALDQAILKVAIMASNPRWFVKKSAEMNLNDFADWSKTFVEVSGSGELDKAMKQIEVNMIDGSVITHLMNKIEELKETSGNRDFSQGSTASGVTAASAIAALQEAGGKLARDVNKTMYRGTQQEGLLEVELIRQFYDEPRSFRIDDDQGGFDFATYPDPMMGKSERSAIFDIKTSAEKQSPFSRAAQNETAKEMYNLGMFNPEMAEQALACLDMMEFEGKDQVKENVQNNSMMMQQFQQMQMMIMQLDQMFPEYGIAAQAGLAAPMPAQPLPAGGAPTEPGTAEERAARTESDTTLTAKARQKAAKQASV